MSAMSAMEPDTDAIPWPLENVSKQYRSAVAAMVQAHISDLALLQSEIKTVRAQCDYDDTVDDYDEIVDVDFPELAALPMMAPAPEKEDGHEIMKHLGGSARALVGPRLHQGDRKLPNIEPQDHPLDREGTSNAEEYVNMESAAGHVNTAAFSTGNSTRESDFRSTLKCGLSAELDFVLPDRRGSAPAHGGARNSNESHAGSMRYSIEPSLMKLSQRITNWKSILQPPKNSCEMALDQDDAMGLDDLVGRNGGLFPGADERLNSVNIFDSQDQNDEHQNSRLMSKLRKMVSHPGFELLTGLLIAANGIFVGFQTDFELTRPQDDPPFEFRAIQYVFTIAFLADLVVRWVASGCLGFLWSRQWAWNYLDIFVVVFSIIEAVVDALLSGRRKNVMSILRLMRFMRMARLARALRLGRLLGLFRAFRVLVFSIIITLKTVFWAVLLLIMMIYMFSLILAQFVGEHIRGEERVQSAIYEYWGTLARVMFTLFKSIMGGLSWHECVVPLAASGDASVFVFLVYICLATLAVLNVITGVFCESAIEGAQQDRDLTVQKHMVKKKEYINALRNLFQEIDNDESNQISLLEFAQHLGGDEAKAFFASLEIEIETAWEIFQLLDVDGEGTIDIDEFITGCLRLRGHATALELARCREIMKRCDEMMTQLVEQRRTSGTSSEQGPTIRATQPMKRPRSARLVAVS